MSISLYKPNSKNAGCAFNFKIGVNRNKEPVVYVSAIQQYSWDDKKKSGNFSGNKDDPEKNINLKFSEFEIGGIIRERIECAVKVIDKACFGAKSQDML